MSSRTKLTFRQQVSTKINWERLDTNIYARVRSNTCVRHINRYTQQVRYTVSTFSLDAVGLVGVLVRVSSGRCAGKLLLVRTVRCWEWSCVDGQFCSAWSRRQPLGEQSLFDAARLGRRWSTEAAGRVTVHSHTTRRRAPPRCLLYTRITHDTFICSRTAESIVMHSRKSVYHHPVVRQPSRT